MLLTANFLRPRLDIRNLASEPLQIVPIHEIPITDLRPIITGIIAVPSLEDLRMLSALPLQRLWAKFVLSVLVEIAAVGEPLRPRGPDSLQRLDELAAPPVPLRVL